MMLGHTQVAANTATSVCVVYVSVCNYNYFYDFVYLYHDPFSAFLTDEISPYVLTGNALFWDVDLGCFDSENFNCLLNLIGESTGARVLRPAPGDFVNSKTWAL